MKYHSPNLPYSKGIFLWNRGGLVIVKYYKHKIVETIFSVRLFVMNLGVRFFSLPLISLLCCLLFFFSIPFFKFTMMVTDDKKLIRNQNNN